MAQSSISGIYELTGIREMASAFKFDADNTFEFFYSYGAIDRMAKGTYEIAGDTVKLKSQKSGGQDFEIKSQTKHGKGYHLVFKDRNVYLTNHITCISYQGTKEVEYETNKNGIVDIQEDKVDKIYAQHKLFPDILSLIKDESNENNYFEMALKPSLGEVSFKGIDLFIIKDGLGMYPNYFMPFENIIYRKAE